MHTALAEDASLGLSTYITKLTTTYDSSSRRADLSGHLYSHVHAPPTHTHTHAVALWRNPETFYNSGFQKRVMIRIDWAAVSEKEDPRAPLQTY